MKVLALCSAIDLRIVGGCTPFYWGIFKALNQLGVEIAVVPFQGRCVETPWWKSFENPTHPNMADRFYDHFADLYSKEGDSGYKSMGGLGSHGASALRRLMKKPATRAGAMYRRVFERRMYGSWSGEIERLTSTVPFDVAVFFAPPRYALQGLPSRLKEVARRPVLLYEADFPTYLYTDSNLKASIYNGLNLNEFDSVIVNSVGVIPRLKELYSGKTFVIDFGVDPSWLAIPPTAKDIDVSFYGYSDYLREEFIRSLIAIPSEIMAGHSFAVTGNRFGELGRANNVGNLDVGQMRKLCARSRISLNITRRTFADTQASSTARLFELAAMGACVVSNPCKGIEKWFEPGKEVYIARDSKEAVELYGWLLDSDEVRTRTGELAKSRALKEHTYERRAVEFLRAIESVT